MSTPDRDKVIEVLRTSAPMTITELSKATGIPRPRVAGAVTNAPRDIFKRAYGTRREGGKEQALYELGSRELPPVATGDVWRL